MIDFVTLHARIDHAGLLFYCCSSIKLLMCNKNDLSNITDCIGSSQTAYEKNIESVYQIMLQRFFFGGLCFILFKWTHICIFRHEMTKYTAHAVAIFVSL